MNLTHYLGCGIIMPSIYIENKNADIQDRFKNYLLLSSSKFTNETDCVLEIVLNPDEEAPQKISENFYLFDMPLPITRIKKIYFINEEQKVSTNFNITSGSAFIPEGLLKVAKEESLDTKELENIEYKPSEKDWTNFLKRYDQILGGFSTMKISKGNFQNYPRHYFSTLGNVNNLFTSSLDNQNISIENSFQFAFTNEVKFKDFHKTIYSDIDYSEVQRYAEKDNVKLEVKNGIVQIDKIPDNKQTYLVAILDSYGKGKRKQVDSFISDLISGKFSEYKKEGIALMFGLNKGYKAFRNKYKTQNFEVDIKFRLESKLDYYVIESIYQNVFNSLNSISSFKYLDNWVPENKNVEIQNSKYITYQIIDKTIILEERVPTPFERVLEKISNIISKWFPFAVKKNEIESLFKADINLFKTELETELENKYKAELQENRVKIEELNYSLLEKQKSLNQLENKIKENLESKIELEKASERKKYSETDKIQSSDIQAVLVRENTDSLFSHDTSFSNIKLREQELKEMDKDKLKAITKKYNINKRKPEIIIVEILKHEFKK